MKDRAAVALACLTVFAASGGADERESLVDDRLAVRHETAGGTLVVSTPEDWVFETRGGQPEVTETRGGGLVVRIVRREGELGLDAWHVQCMEERLAGPMKAHPHVQYEYDFRQGWIGDRQALDSAFVVQYDEEIGGHKDWRQRNVSVVGGGESLCLIGMAPRRVWKKSKEDRKLLEAVLTSIRFD
jgi:hypothetical protein